MSRTNRILSIVLVALLTLSIPLAASAAEYDLSVGNITITTEATGVIVKQVNGKQTDDIEEDETVITQADSSTATSNNIQIHAENHSVEITVRDINLVSDKPGINTTGDNQVTVNFEGDNYIEATAAEAAIEAHGAHTTLNGEEGSTTTVVGSNYGIASLYDGSSTEDYTLDINNMELDVTGENGGIFIGARSANNAALTITDSEVTATSKSGKGAALISGKDADYTFNRSHVIFNGTVLGTYYGACTFVTNGCKVIKPTDYKRGDADKGANTEMFVGHADGTIADFSEIYKDKEPIDLNKSYCPYWVTDLDDNRLSWEEDYENGVLTVTARYAQANFNTTYAGLCYLRTEGVKTIIYITDGARSQFEVSNALASTFENRLIITHDNSTVKLTVSDQENSAILN